MKDEIKEILDKLKDKNNYISHSMILLSIKETTLILDYITNLQEELAFIKNDYKKVVNSNEDNILIMHKALKYVNSTDFIYDEQYKKKDKLENILKWW